MYRPPQGVDDGSRQVLKALTGNGTLHLLITFGERMLAQEEKLLHDAALAALVNPQERDGAVLRLGRVEMLRTLIDQAKLIKE